MEKRETAFLKIGQRVDYRIALQVMALVGGKADPRLFDAAPDLLAACKEALCGLDAEYGQRVVDTNFGLLRAAIAKAEGSE